MKRKVQFPALTGLIAADPKAHKADFFILDFGRPAFSQVEGKDYCVVDVCGPLVQHNTWCYPSYDGLRANFLAALESDASTIVLRVESPGGDFAGCLELARWMRAETREHGKRLLAFTDSQALSAAYAIASAADEIAVTPSGFVGSIGVWAPLQDQTALDRAMGLNIQIVSSGEQKAERNPHVPITDSAVANLQVEVDAMAGLFFDVVAENRGIPRAKVVAIQGAQRFGAEAVAANLADYLVNGWDDFISRLENTKQGATPMASSLKEMRAGYRTSLAKKAAEDSDEGREAASELAAWDKEEAKKAKKAEDSEPAEDKEAKAKAAAEEDEKKKEEAKAKEEEDKKEAKALAESREAAAAHAVALAGRVHALEAQIAADKLSAARAELLRGRADFSKEILATLADQPLEVVRKACETWPRIPSAQSVSTGANFPGGSQGDASTMPKGVAPGSQRIGAAQLTESEYIDRKVNGQAPTRGVIQASHSTELGFMTPEEAKAHLAKLEATMKGGK